MSEYQYIELRAVDRPYLDARLGPKHNRMMVSWTAASIKLAINQEFDSAPCTSQRSIPYF